MFIFKAKPKNPLDNEEIRLLFANIDLILANADKILQNEKYKNIGVKGSGIDGIYIGHVNLFLGDLISLWSNGSPWRNGQKFYYHLGGSPLSGVSFVPIGKTVKSVVTGTDRLSGHCSNRQVR